MRLKRNRERGSALVEFLLSGLFWVPLLLGTIFIGIRLTRSISIAQICRDSGHMYGYGVDFSQTANQSIVIRLGQGFDLSANGGGVIIFSKIHMVQTLDCEASSLSVCPNNNQAVFTQRIYIGNRSARPSDFGTPLASIVDSSGNLSPARYLTDSSARAGQFTDLLPLLPGQDAFLTEAYFAQPDLSWTGFIDNSGIYSRAIF